jgi:hypothetical protein
MARVMQGGVTWENVLSCKLWAGVRDQAPHASTDAHIQPVRRPTASYPGPADTASNQGTFRKALAASAARLSDLGGARGRRGRPNRQPAPPRQSGTALAR